MITKLKWLGVTSLGGIVEGVAFALAASVAMWIFKTCFCEKKCDD